MKLMADARIKASKDMDEEERLAEIERKERMKRRAPDGELLIVEDRRKSTVHVPPSKFDQETLPNAKTTNLGRPSVRPGMSAEELAELGLPGQVKETPEWAKRSSTKPLGRGSKTRATLGGGPRGSVVAPSSSKGSKEGSVARAARKGRRRG